MFQAVGHYHLSDVLMLQRPKLSLFCPSYLFESLLFHCDFFTLMPPKFISLLYSQTNRHGKLFSLSSDSYNVKRDNCVLENKQTYFYTFTSKAMYVIGTWSSHGKGRLTLLYVISGLKHSPCELKSRHIFFLDG